MLKKIKIYLYIIILLCSIFFTVYLINDLFVVHASCPHDLAFRGFYDLNKNTIDVISFGNSHSFMGINTTYIENQLAIDVFQIKSRSGEIENIVYQLEECLKTQSPKIVLLEMFSLYEFNTNDEALIKEEEIKRNHWAFDTIRFSKTKIDAINNNVFEDKKINYYFPIIPFHLRWKDKDINIKFSEFVNDRFNIIEYDGFIPGFRLLSNIQNDYLPSIDYNSQAKYVSDSKIEALQKFIQICEDNEIEILFLSIPFESQYNFTYQDQYDSIKYVKQTIDFEDIHYIDFYPLMQELKLDKTHFDDDGHMNFVGSTIIAQYTSDYIKKNMREEIESCTLDYKVESEAEYLHMMNWLNGFKEKRKSNIIKNRLSMLNYKGNISEYLLNINSNEYITVISSKNSAPKFIDNNVKNAANELNIDIDNNNGENYIAIINGKTDVFELDSNKAIQITNDDEKIKALSLPFKLDVMSSNINTGSNSYIKINEEDYSINQDGFNIVIYDKVLDKVVNQANFNLNTDIQHYFDRDLAPSKYDKNKILYTFDTKSKINGLLGASGSEVNENGVIIHSNSDDPRFNLSDYGFESNHILLKAEIECPYATWFEIRFNDLIEREQLVTGENTIYIEMNIDEPISYIRIDPANSQGDFLIKNIDICDLSR